MWISPPRSTPLNEVVTPQPTLGYLNANAGKHCLFLSVISKNGEEIKHKNLLKQS